MGAWVSDAILDLWRHFRWHDILSHDFLLRDRMGEISRNSLGPEVIYPEVCHNQRQPLSLSLTSRPKLTTGRHSDDIFVTG